MKDRQIVLEVSPLGDAQMASAIAKALRVQDLDVSMLVSKLGAQLLSCVSLPLYTERENVPRGAIVVDVCQYLNQNCHRAKLSSIWAPSDDEVDRRGFGHLVTWMAKHVYTQLLTTGVSLNPIPCGAADVVLYPSQERVDQACHFLDNHGVTQEKDLVILCADAGSPNRWIPPGLLAQVVDSMKGEAVFALLAPTPKGVPGYEALDVVRLPMVPLDLLPALLTVADAIVAPDTGPAHIAAAAIQGRREVCHPRELIWVCGSSNPLALQYPGNQAVMAPTHTCDAMPCGWHGYTVPPEQLGGQLVYRGGDGGSACINCDYQHQPAFALCMEAVVASEVVSAIRTALT